MLTFALISLLSATCPADNEIVIEETVTEIPNNAYQNCVKAKALTLHETKNSHWKLCIL